MGTIAMQEILASFGVKDLATKEMKKLEKEVEKTIKDFKTAEKEMSVFGKKFASLKKGGAGIGSKVTTVAGGGGSGLIGGIGGAAGGLGMLVAAPIMAMRESVQRFTSGLELKHATELIALEFNRDFSEELRKSLESVDSFFLVEDIQKAFSGLAQKGIDPKLIEKSSDILATFSKAQGFTSLEEGLKALQSGALRYGRGLDEIAIRQIENLAPNIARGGRAAELSFEVITSILERSSKSLKESANITDANFGAIQKASNKVAEINKDLILDSVRNNAEMQKGLETFRVSADVEKSLNRVIDTIGKASGKAVGKITEFLKDLEWEGMKKSFLDMRSAVENTTEMFGKAGTMMGKEFIDPFVGTAKKLELLFDRLLERTDSIPPGSVIPKRAGGGTILKNRPVQVGETGPETIIPTGTGRVYNESQLAAGNSITATINIHAGEGNPMDIKRAVKQALNELSKTTFRQASALPMRG